MTAMAELLVYVICLDCIAVSREMRRNECWGQVHVFVVRDVVVS